MIKAYSERGVMPGAAPPPLTQPNPTPPTGPRELPAGAETGARGAPSITPIEIQIGYGSQSAASTPQTDVEKVRDLLAGGNAIVGTLAGLGQYAIVRDGAWYDLHTGNWYSFGYYGNKWRIGAHVAAYKGYATSFTRAMRITGRAAFFVSVGVSGYDGIQALRSDDSLGVGKAGLDFGVAYIGISGGLGGVIIAGGYFAVDATVGWAPAMEIQPSSMGASSPPGYSE